MCKPLRPSGQVKSKGVVPFILYVGLGTRSSSFGAFHLFVCRGSLLWKELLKLEEAKRVRLGEPVVESKSLLSEVNRSKRRDLAVFGSNKSSRLANKRSPEVLTAKSCLLRFPTTIGILCRDCVKNWVICKYKL